MISALLHASHGAFDPFAVTVETLIEFLRLLPFLFLACLVSEWLTRSSRRARAMLSGGGALGPFFGSLLGAIPQCGLSAAAARLYAARLISIGTLLAVFLSTSDEMLIVLIAGGIPALTVLFLVVIKCLIGLAVGFAIDLLFRERSAPVADLDAIDDSSPCPCGCCGNRGGTGWVSLLFGAFRHTLSISFYLLLTMLGFALLLSAVGEARLGELLSSAGFLTPLLASLVGLIPSCAVSVVLSELWMVGAISTGSLLSGLLVGAGVGVLVLFRVNRPFSSTLKVIALLLGFGLGFGLLLDLTGIGALLRP